METGAWTKSEYFAWNDGRRIVDLQELAEQLHCKQCGSVLDLQRTEREARYGFASVLYIHCNCGLMNDVYTCRLQQNGEKSVDSASTPVFEINNEASINVLMYGGSSSSVILKFLALLDIPVPPRSEAFCHGRNNTTDTSVGAELAPLPPSSSAAGTDWGWTMSASGDRGATSRKSLPVPVAISESDCVERPAPEAYSSANDDNNGVAVQITNNNMYIVGDVYHVEEDGLDSSGSVGDGLDDKDDEYVPPDELKQRLKAQIKSKKRKPVARRPRNTAAKSPAKKAPPAKSPAKKASPRKPVKKLKVKVKEESKEDTMEGQENEKGEKAKEKKQKDEEEEREGEGSDDNDKDMDWSSTESEEDKPVVEKGKSKRGGGPRPKGGKLKQGQGGECTECSKTFVSVKGYNVHMKRVHNQDMKERPRKRLKADGSGEMESEWAVVKEEPVKGSVYLCPECHSLYAQPKCLILHLKKFHQIDSPNVDEHGISMEGSIVRVRMAYKRAPSLTSRSQRCSFRCLMCQTTVQNRAKLSSHIRVEAATKTLSCAAVNPDARRMGSYQGSMFLSKHGDKDQHLCHLCGATFMKKGSLRMHVSNHVEAMPKMLVCDRCPFSTGSLSSFKYHRWRYHSTKPRLRSHVCEFCGKGFYERASMRRHVENAHVKDKDFKCEVCSKVFHNARGFGKHMRNHRVGRQFECVHCGRTFKTAYNLKVHERLHTGEKPYQCHHCSAAFAQKNSLDVHMKKHTKHLKPHHASHAAFGSHNRAFTSSDRSFASNDRAFASNDRTFASNDRAFASNDRAFASNDRAFASNDRAFATSGGAFADQDEGAFPGDARDFTADGRPLAAGGRSFEDVRSLGEDRLYVDERPLWQKDSSALARKHNLDSHINKLQEKAVGAAVTSDPGPFGCDLAGADLVLKKSPSHSGTLSEDEML